MSIETREELLDSVRKAVHDLNNKKITSKEFARYAGIHRNKIYDLFPEGGWTEVVEILDLSSSGKGYSLSDDEIFEEYHRIVLKLGKIPTWALVAKHAKFSSDTIRKRFNGTKGTLLKYREWLELNHPDSDILSMISIESKHEVQPPIADYDTDTNNIVGSSYAKNDSIVYGPLISFRGMTHAPINEQGVVYLFGMVSYELGFIVESVQSAFPDCEAKRCIDLKRNRWQRVRIEFEFKSSNFKQHCHDPSGCDLIICWEHDWDDCPIEVLQLRTAINSLDS